MTAAEELLATSYLTLAWPDILRAGAYNFQSISSCTERIWPRELMVTACIWLLNLLRVLEYSGSKNIANVFVPNRVFYNNQCKITETITRQISLLETRATNHVHYFILGSIVLVVP